MIRRLLAIWHARNLEFLRDRGALVFSLLLPLALIVGMSFVFGGPERAIFKVAVLTDDLGSVRHPFMSERFVDFVPVDDLGAASRKVARHQFDLLIDFRPGATRYWVNTDSPKGYVAERLLLQAEPAAVRQPVVGKAVRYVDWLFPGILGMNMMFNCLFGVGYVVLRYRKSGFLKRLNATPITAFEFLAAQVLSRLALILAVTTILYVGVGLVIGFHSAGNPALLLAIATLGALSLIALGLTIAARFSSDELVGGLLNTLTWPMMLLSGVWFSLEGSPDWIQHIALVFPLTHSLDAARADLFAGAGAAAIAPHLLYLAATTLAFLAFGAWSFKWRAD
ncbi:MAG: ABC transporter permease [Steroidobacteraceae bacterium]